MGKDSFEITQEEVPSSLRHVDGLGVGDVGRSGVPRPPGTRPEG